MVTYGKGMAQPALAGAGRNAVIWSNHFNASAVQPERSWRQIVGNSNLIKCRKCGADFSIRANRCPKCNNPSFSVVTAKCRSCGKAIIRSEHLRKETSSYVHNGSTQYRSHYVYLPCPHCGDPKPLFKIERKIYWIWFLLFFFVAFLSFIYCLYALNINHGKLYVDFFASGLFCVVSLVFAALCAAKIKF
jgi:predicted RNA-binding Zn-ribbon protein involved in translation (DUF1610 family)